MGSGLVNTDMAGSKTNALRGRSIQYKIKAKQATYLCYSYHGGWFVEIIQTQDIFLSLFQRTHRWWLLEKIG